MIYEFALDPDVVSTWTERNACKRFMRDFGRGTARLVSRYPKKWKKMVWEAHKSHTPLEQKRLEELLIRLSDCMVRRCNYTWDNQRSWAENAINENERCTFRAIISLAKSTAHPFILCPDELDDYGDNSWIVEEQRSVPRNAEAMAEAVGSILAICRKAIFVDPYFIPEKREFREPLKRFLYCLVRNRVCPIPEVVEVHCSEKTNRSAEFFRISCEKHMPHHIPEGLRVIFKQWKQRGGGERLHPRLILTDIGGVWFEGGLDESNDESGCETVDVIVLKSSIHDFRWNQYVGNNLAFDLAQEPIEIIGEAPLEP